MAGGVENFAEAYNLARSHAQELEKPRGAGGGRVNFVMQSKLLIELLTEAYDV